VVLIAKVITFAHYKGGTGKTTSCINIAGFLQKKGFKVLVVDIDPQGNLTSGMGVDKKSVKYSMYHVMKSKLDIRYAVLKTLTKGIHIAPADLNLIRATLNKYKSRKDSEILKNALEDVKDYYDFILIDTPPSNGHFIVNGVAASDFVILVLDPGIFSVEGVESFNNLFCEYSKRIKFNVNIGMALINKHKSPLIPLFTKDYTKEINEDIAKAIGKKIFTLPYSYAVLESQIKGLPLSHVRPYSSIGRAYKAITNEILGLFEQNIKNG